MNNSYKDNIPSVKEFSVADELQKRSHFSIREVGLNHPDVNSFIKLNDDGDIEIFATAGIGMVISASGRSISLFADKIKFFSSENELRWNNFNFNYSATDYSQPTLVKINKEMINSGQNNAQHYLDKLKTIQEEELKLVTINSDYGFESNKSKMDQSYSSLISTEGLSDLEIMLVQNILKEHSKEYIEYLIDLLKEGSTTFAQAKLKADEVKNV